MTDRQEKENFVRFTIELEELSKKHGVAIQSTGGVLIGDIENISYCQDHTSGDLNPTIEWEIKEGDNVVIPKDLTTDPCNRQGQGGKVINKVGSVVTVKFPDNGIAYYYNEVFSYVL